ncbi:hypothetical protein TEQG_08452 [Trichophyton equinum CBS 127.97]|uniref:Uncharacterized protein n=1 Tax=Trichophyton equinum (strain ATCC MYA-4606 / CBS 127.97) TaxID=559882 RepID=F2Q5T5_TRIEC|nr:hypothetical protein TEQG_08452 [Trichophyton equinum CBS 127.97]
MFRLSPAKPSPPGTNPKAPPTSSEYDNGLRVEAKNVYMVLSSTGLPRKYHWSILIASNELGGLIFHQTLNGTIWRYVPDITAEWMDAIKQCIQAAEVPGDGFSCRAWALAAVYELANCGFIGMEPSWEIMKKIEEEANDIAMDALFSNQKLVMDSQQCTI